MSSSSGTVVVLVKKKPPDECEAKRVRYGGGVRLLALYRFTP
jgi:hypothetical protein